MRTTRPAALVALAGLAAVVLAVLLGMLTFGVQASVTPRGLPLAVAAPPGAPQLTQVAQQVASHGGDQVSWRVTTPAQAQRLLEDKAVYGVLELDPSGRHAVVLSGAVNPNATQVAQQALTAAGEAASGAGGGQAQPVVVRMLHSASAAGRTAPLAASALLWIGTLIGSLLLVVISGRGGRRPSSGQRAAVAVAVALGATAAVLALMALWERRLLDRDVAANARMVGFLLLTAFAFAAAQGAVLRLAGIAGLALLAPLYLMAPSVAGQVPQLLHPAYRTLLWSWSPMRFSAEGVRSLLLQDSVPPDVRAALWVLGGMVVGGLAVLLAPGRRPGRSELAAEPSHDNPGQDDSSGATESGPVPASPGRRSVP